MTQTYIVWKRPWAGQGNLSRPLMLCFVKRWVLVGKSYVKLCWVRLPTRKVKREIIVARPDTCERGGTLTLCPLL